ncbi:LapA family protein [Actinoplanes sp. GCM10030250]|uniref:LapA family protein n=1 Tax=Actinoplanes sp. GCM10030250 TaxID=3273376 RepID=UPI0036146C25
MKLIKNPAMNPFISIEFRPRVARSDLMSAAMLPAMSKESERSALRLEQSALRAEQAELQVEKLRLQVATLEADIRQLRDKDRVTLQIARFALLQRLVEAFGWALVVAAAYFPLQAVEPLARSFGSNDAEPSASLKILIAFAAIVGIGWLVTGIQSRLRKRKIKAQRRRLDELEKELGEKSPPIQKAGT